MNGPVLAQCEPLRCRNVALTADNRSMLTAHIAKLNDQLADAEVLAPYVRHRLQQRRDDIAAFLTAHDHQQELR